MKPLLRLCHLSASQDEVDGRWSLVIISPSFHFWGILEQSRIKIEWLKVNCFKIFSTYHMIWALFCNRFWEIYDRGTSLSCMHTNCVQKLEPGRCSGLLNPEYRICSQLTLCYVKKTDTYFRFHREISIKMYRTSRLRCKKHIKMVIFTEFWSF